MRLHITVVIVLFSSILAAQTDLKSPLKFRINQINGNIHIIRSTDGTYNSFEELPKSVKEEFLRSSAAASPMKSIGTKTTIPTAAFVVSNASDAEDTDLNDGVYSPATLRSAIQNANKFGGSYAISFSPGITVIQPATALPSVNVALIIDGTVSAGKVILDGSVSTGTYGLTLGKTSTVKNMIFKSWKNVGLGLTSGAVNSIVQRNEFTLNKIGLNINAAGTLVGGEAPEDGNVSHGNTQDGIDVVFANDNTLINNYCGTKDGLTASPNTYSGMYILGERTIVQYNLISGNDDSGLELGEFSKKTLVKGNYIGLNHLGTGKLQNAYDGISTFADNDSIIENYISGNGYGITVLGQSSQAYIGNNMIGSNATFDSLFGNRFGGMQILGTQVVIDNNTISCNTGSGILLTGNGGAVVKRNYIGVDPTGQLDWGNSGSGINIVCDNNIIGGPADEDINIISGNGKYGIEMFGGTTISFPGGSKPNYAQGNIIQNNYIGTDHTGAVGIPNHSGIMMQGYVDSNFVASNLISGNQHHGIWMQAFGGSPTRNMFTNNYIGTKINGATALPNLDRGIYILSGSNNIIGGETFSYKNLISGNNGPGVWISGSSSGNLIRNNIIGANLSGSSALYNYGDGVLIDQAASNNVIQKNLISGNSANGVYLGTNSNMTPDGNVIIGNTIGLEISKNFSLPNSYNGIYINNARNTLIGGSDVNSGNTISGNLINGIYLYGDTSRGNRIRGNYIGTNFSGTAAIPNYRGVLVWNANENMVGGSENNSGNLISGNHHEGIYLYLSDSNMVFSNFVGLDINESKVLPNGGSGILIDSSNYNSIGGDHYTTGNTISGNKSSGIVLTSSATGNMIFNNLIGTDGTFTKKFGNEGDGVQLLYGVNRTSIGKDSAGNIIWFNKLAGVLVADSNENSISANSIYDNGELGIDLYSGFYGTTLNDAHDIDVGANNLQNFPELLFADGPFPLRVLGILQGKPNETYRIEIFGAGDSDSTKYGEGRNFYGSHMATADSLGLVIIKSSFPYSAPVGTFITATATDSPGNTSEFSKCIRVNVSDVYSDVSVTIKANADTVKKSDTLQYVIMLHNIGPDSAKQIVVKDSLSKFLTFISDSSSKGETKFADGILTVTIDALEPGEKVKIILLATADSTGSIHNTVYASVGTNDFDTSNNSSSDTIVVPTVLTVGNNANEIPTIYTLQQNYPNPFNPTTTIRFGVPVTSSVRLIVYNILGKEIARLVNGVYPPGYMNVLWSAPVASGVYFYRIESISVADPSKKFSQTKRMMFIK